MAIASVSSSSSNNGASNTSSITVTHPAGLDADWLMVAAVVARGGSGTTITPPDGWTLIRSDNTGSASGDIIVSSYYKVAGGSEPFDYTWTFSPSVRAVAGIQSFTGANNASPINVHEGSVNASSTSITAPSVTTTVAGCYLITFFGTAVGTSDITGPSGMTAWWLQTPGNGRAGKGADVSVPSAGATGSKVATAGSAAVNIGQSIAIQPAGSGTTVSPTGIASSEAFGTASISRTVSPTGIASGEGFGTAAIARTVSPSSIASAEGFGTPLISLVALPSGIASTESFGTPALSGDPTIAPSGIASSESFGSPTLSQTFVPGGIASAESFGTPSVAEPGVITLIVTGIASGEAFGSPLFGGDVAVTPEGIASSEAFGVPYITDSYLQTLTPEPIVSSEAFGTPTVQDEAAAGILPSGIASAEGFGTPRIDLSVDVPSIDVTEAFGTPTLSITVSPSGIAAGAFGSPTVTGVSVGSQVVLKVKDPPSGHAAIFVVDDILRIKAFNGGGVIDNWLRVDSVDTSPADHVRYTVTRMSGTAGTFPAGATIVNYGHVTGGNPNPGYVLMSSDGSNSPYIEVATHTGSPWSSITPRVRMGNLGGVLGLSTQWGIAMGTDLSDTALTARHIVVSDQQLKLSNIDLTAYASGAQRVNLSSTGDLKLGTNVASTGVSFDFTAATGVLRVGLSSGPNVYWDGTDMHIRAGSTSRITLSSAGVLSIKDSSGNARISLDGSGNASIEGVLTIGTSGEIRQGTGTLGSNFTGLRMWRDGSVGRIGGYNNNVLQWNGGTDGKLYAGTGTWLDASGLGMDYTIGSDASAIKWYNAGSVFSSIVGKAISSARGIFYSTQVHQFFTGTDVDMEIGAGYVKVLGGLNLGSATGAGAGQLKLSGSIAQSTGIGARVYHNTNQSIANTTATILSFNSERFDTDSIHSTSSNTSRLTCQTAGLYTIAVNVVWNYADSVAGLRNVAIKLNGTTIIARDVRDANADSNTVQAFATQYQLAVNDYIEVEVYQNSGTAVNVVSSGASNWSPEFSMARHA